MRNRVKHLLKMGVVQQYFTAPVALFFLLSTILYFSLGNTAIHLFINQHSASPQADFLFAGITELGNGAVVFILLPVLLLVDINIAVRLVIAFVLCTLVVWLCKFVLFSDALRPVAAIADGYDILNLVPGVKMHRTRSFPSGHASTVFTIFCSFAFAARSNFVKSLLFVLAMVIAFSRVYLSQHFLQDVAAGALTGTVCTLLVFVWLNKYRYYWKPSKFKRLHQLAVDVKK